MYYTVGAQKTVIPEMFLGGNNEKLNRHIHFSKRLINK